MTSGDALGGGKGRRNDLSRIVKDRYAGLFLSFIAGTTASAVAYFSHADLGTSVSLGVVVFVAGQLIDLSFRIESWVEELSRRTASVEAELTATRASLRDLSEASALESEFKKAILHLTSGKGEIGAELANTLGRIVEALPNIPPLLAGYTRDKLELTAGALAAKNFQEVGEDVPYIGTILARDFRKCLFATSLFPLPFWETGWGQSYHDEMCRRVSQSHRGGSRILAQRVFIVRHGAEADLAGDSYHHRMVREQIAAGIEIRACFETDLAFPDFRQDFGIWDHELAVLVQVSVGADGIRRVTGTKYQYEKGEIARLEGMAQKIWSVSRPFDSWLAGQNP